MKDPAFAPDPVFLLQEPQKQQLGFESFCMLLSSIFPKCISQSRLVLTVSLYFMLDEMLSRYSGVPGPSRTHVETDKPGQFTVRHFRLKSCVHCENLRNQEVCVFSPVVVVMCILVRGTSFAQQPGT